jgi:hypothetical protein
MSNDDLPFNNTSRSASPEPEIQLDQAPEVDQSPPPRSVRFKEEEARRDQNQRQVQQDFLGSPREDPTRALTQPVNQAVGQVGQTANQVGKTAGEAVGKPGGSSGKDTLKLRLDLNLDVDVQIKARVHGDVTLSLL